MTLYEFSIHRLPIEVIKANLYSKESDVYAFGMVTWEVMTAFGQEGVIYHGDEETESLCIPFNYQQSENVKALLIFIALVFIMIKSSLILMFFLGLIPLLNFNT